MIFTADIRENEPLDYQASPTLSNRLILNSYRLLGLLAEHQVKGTFFVQGLVGQQSTHLIRAIAADGHELACHSYSLRPLDSLNETVFRAELRRSIRAIEDTTGKPVLGFRAPAPISGEVIDWYSRALEDHNIRYDSSFFGQQHGLTPSEEVDELTGQIRTYELDCYPAMINVLKGSQAPALGGSYFSRYPYAFTRWLCRKLDKNQGVFYLPVGQLDKMPMTGSRAQQLLTKAPWTKQLLGRSSVENKLRQLFKEFNFTSFQAQYYSSHSLVNMA